jgi:hypothetical protein
VNVDQWAALGIVCGALLSLLTLIGVLYRWVVLPVWRTLRRLNEVADQLLGDKTKKIPSMTERMSTLEDGQRELRAQLQAHLDGHLFGTPKPARPR